MAVELPYATPDFDRIRRDVGVETEDAIRLIWLMLQDEINRRERLSQTVGGTSGHNLLSPTHPDTIPADPIQGDIIVALGSTPVDNFKYWLDGEAIIFENDNSDTGGLKYWHQGSAFAMGGFGATSGSGTKWQRKALGAAGTVLTSTGTEADWIAPESSNTLVAPVDTTYDAFPGTNNNLALGDVLTLPIDASGHALGTVVITGLQGGEEGRVILLVNVGTDGDFQLAEEDANSDAANRFRVAVAPREPGTVVVLVYVDGRWNANGG